MRIPPVIVIFSSHRGLAGSAKAVPVVLGQWAGHSEASREIPRMDWAEFGLVAQGFVTDKRFLEDITIVYLPYYTPIHR